MAHSSSSYSEDHNRTTNTSTMTMRPTTVSRADSQLDGAMSEHYPGEKDQDADSLDLLLSRLESNKAEDVEDQCTNEAYGIGRPVSETDLNTDPAIGLTTEEVYARVKRYGINTLAGKEHSLVLQFLSYFVGPIQFCMIAALLLAIGLFDWIDVGVICALLMLNAVVGFAQEYKARQTVESLKKQIASKSTVLRDGKWEDVDSDSLVPGDIYKIEEGNVVAADCRIVNKEARVQMDQSAITGESQAVSKKQGDICFSSANVKRGEAIVIVTATGKSTQAGRTQIMCEQASMEEGHFTKVINTIGTLLLSYVILTIFVVWVGSFFRSNSIVKSLRFTLCLAIVGVPVGLPVVVTTTMAVGAHYLAKKKAAVQNLSAIESLAGVEILCSDKTGTLTKNKLTAGEPYLVGNIDADDLILTGCLAASRNLKGIEPIDKAFLMSLKTHPNAKAALQSYTVIDFEPFDPVTKRVTATVNSPTGERLICTKGAPLVVSDFVNKANPLGDETNKTYRDKLADLSARGLRAIGVARKQGNKPWQLLGLVPISDPPRDDTAETIAEAKRLGLDIKMLTGDAKDIAIETSRLLGLGTDIYDPSHLGLGPQGAMPGSEAAELIKQADGFAGVFPDHKYQVVESLQRSGYLVAMTGDGVNDAPSLKKADTGIAVQGATETARDSADIVFLAPGLSAIIDSIKTSRQIFHRMYAYIVYRIALSMHLLIYFGLQQLILNESMDIRLVVFLAIFCDIATLAIAYDHAPYSMTPDKWNLKKLWGMSIALGLVLAAGSWIAHATLLGFHDLENFPTEHAGLVQKHGTANGIMFLQIALSENWLIFITRAKGPFWSGGLRYLPSWQLAIAILAVDIIASCMVVFGAFTHRTDIVTVVQVWVFCFGVFFVCAAVYVALNSARWFDDLMNGRLRGKGSRQRMHEEMIVALEKVAIAHNYPGAAGQQSTITKT